VGSLSGTNNYENCCLPSGNRVVGFNWFISWMVRRRSLPAPHSP
jgi:hypothetical protein